MAIPRFIVDELPSSGVVELPAEEAKHASGVLRMSAGQDVVLFDGRGGEAAAKIESIDRKRTSVSIDCRLDTNRELAVGLKVFVSLPKGDRQRTLVEGMVQLGVADLVPLECHRSVAQPTDNALQRLRRYVVEASKQCGRNQLMQIADPCSLADIAQPDDKSLRLLCHPYDASVTIPSMSASIGVAKKIELAIGPEGGFTEQDVALLRSSDWQLVSLGPRILRVEMATLAAVAMVSQAGVRHAPS